MKKYYNVELTKNGYKLVDGNEVILMNPSKYPNIAYYLKQVSPTVENITGLFYNKEKNFYRGKDLDKNTVILRLGMQYATIDRYKPNSRSN
jgi:hypothetical protein